MENNKPAFPTKVTYENDRPAAYQCGDISFQEIGLTKREMMAAMINVSKDMQDWTLNFFEKLMGRPAPADTLEAYIYWAEAEAKLRVIKANALLNELSKS